MNSLPKTVTRQRSDCDLNPGPSAPESSTLTTRLPSHPTMYNVEGTIKRNRQCINNVGYCRSMKRKISKCLQIIV